MKVTVTKTFTLDEREMRTVQRALIRSGGKAIVREPVERALLEELELHLGPPEDAGAPG